MFYINLTISFTQKYTKSILGICFWLFVSPIFIALILSVTVASYLTKINQDNLFIIIVCTLIILLWCISALILDKDKVKASLLINNAILTTILAISFLSTIDDSFSKIIYDKSYIDEAISIGISPNSIIELLIKLLTLPYVLGAIWSSVLIELRHLDILTLEKFLNIFKSKKNNNFSNF